MFNRFSLFSWLGLSVFPIVHLIVRPSFHLFIYPCQSTMDCLQFEQKKKYFTAWISYYTTASSRDLKLITLWLLSELCALCARLSCTMVSYFCSNRVSSNAMGRFCAFALQYYLRVPQIDQRYAQVNLRHVCCHAKQHGSTVLSICVAEWPTQWVTCCSAWVLLCARACCLYRRFGSADAIGRRRLTMQRASDDVLGA